MLNYVEEGHMGETNDAKLCLSVTGNKKQQSIYQRELPPVFYSSLMTFQSKLMRDINFYLHKESLKLKTLYDVFIIGRKGECFRGFRHIENDFFLYDDIYRWFISDDCTTKIRSNSTHYLTVNKAFSIKFQCKEDEFACGDKTCILEKYICDGKNDCTNAEDENNKFCMILSTSQTEKPFCGNHHIFCMGMCVSFDQICQSAFICFPTMFCKGHQKRLKKFKKIQPPSLQINCLYNRYSTGSRQNEFLLFCSSVLCPKQFKCPNTYCVPLFTVCDGVRDCPDGEDEMECGDVLSCPGVLRCVKENLCVYCDQVCDGIIHCHISQDDEGLCQGEFCPESCFCFLHSVICQKFDNTSKTFHFGVLAWSVTFTDNYFEITDLAQSLESLYNLINLDLENTSISELPDYMFKVNKYLLKLNIRYNKINSLSYKSFFNLSLLALLHLSGNYLVKLDAYAFHYLVSLPTLMLSCMFLKDIENNAFLHLVNLVHLDLHGNMIAKLPKSFMKQLPLLKILNLRTNPLTEVYFEMFSANAHLYSIITDQK